MNENESLKDSIEQLTRAVESLNRRIDRLESELLPPESTPTAAPPPLPVSPPPVHASAPPPEIETASAIEPAPPEEIPVQPAAVQAPLMQDAASAPPETPITDSPLPVSPAPTTPISNAPASPSTATSRSSQNWELKLASYWFPRIGAVALVIGIAMFAREHLQFLNNPYTKVLGSYLFAFVLIGLGFYKHRQLPVWSQPIIATGLALTYFTTYAMMFVAPMKIISNLGVELALLAVNLAGIFFVAHHKKSEVIGGMALVLGYLTAGMIGHDRAALYSSLALSCIAVLFLWLNRWVVSTAVACVGTYLAHFYVWQFLSPESTQPVSEVFRHHALFLSMYFTVFTAAGLFGVQRLKNDPVEASLPGLRSTKLVDLLAVMVQGNNAIFFGAMLYLFRETEIYWDQVHTFLFGFSALCFGLSLAARAIPAIQGIYLFSGTVAFTVALIMRATDFWLPLLMGIQAIIMLLFARRRFPMLWGILSSLVIVYALTYALEDVASALRSKFRGEHPFGLLFRGGGWVPITMICIAATWVVTFSKQLPDFVKKYIGFAPYVIALISVFSLLVPLGDVATRHSNVVALALVGIIGTMLSYFFRVPALSVYPLLGSGFLFIYSIVMLFDYKEPTIPIVLIVITAFLGSAAVHEIRGSGKKWLDNTVALVGYVGAQSFLISMILDRGASYVSPLLIGALVFAIPFLARKIHSKSLLYSGALSIIYAVIYCNGGLMPRTSTEIGTIVTLTVMGLISGSGIIANARKTEESLPRVNTVLLELYHFFCVFFPVWGLYYWCYDNHTPLESLATLTGYLAVLHFFLTRSGNYKSVSINYVVLGITLFVVLPRLLTTSIPRDIAMHQTFYGILAGFFVVIMERVNFERYRINKIPEAVNFLLKPRAAELVSAVLILTSIGTILVSLFFYPYKSPFMFTTAIVVLGFMYVVLGFAFKADFYRKSGFIMLCFGILKAGLWDVSKMDNSLYKIISWLTLGSLIIAASFLYNRFAGKDKS